MSAVEAFWERECAVAALADQAVCPEYGIPCWACMIVSMITGLLRCAYLGQWDMTHGRNFDWTIPDDRVLWERWVEREAQCNHTVTAWTPQDFDDIAEAPIPTPVTPARKVSDVESQTEAPEEATGRVPLVLPA